MRILVALELFFPDGGIERHLFDLQMARKTMLREVTRLAVLPTWSRIRSAEAAPLPAPGRWRGRGVGIEPLHRDPLFQKRSGDRAESDSINSRYLAVTVSSDVTALSCWPAVCVACQYSRENHLAVSVGDATSNPRTRKYSAE